MKLICFITIIFRKRIIKKRKLWCYVKIMLKPLENVRIKVRGLLECCEKKE